MMRNMVTSLIDHGQIVTTVTRAKELRRLADRMVTLGKRGDLHARRQALSVIRTKQAVAKLFDEIAPLFIERNGGYTRIVKIGPRRGDASMMALIEFATAPMGGKSEKKTPAPGPESPVHETPSVIPTAVAASAESDLEGEGTVVEHETPTESVVQAEANEEVAEETAQPVIEEAAPEEFSVTEDVGHEDAAEASQKDSEEGE